MTMSKKQLKITKLFKKNAAPLPEDCEELQQEVAALERRLKDRQMQLFLAQRESRRGLPARRQRVPDLFVRPQKLIAQNSADHLKRNIELMSMLTGMQVKEYVAGEHCVVVYHMQHPDKHHIEHGLRISMKSGTNVVTRYSLPVGFNFSGVVDQFDNVMTPECLGAVRAALDAFYDRRAQFDALKSLLSFDAALFKTLDASHVQVSCRVRSALAPGPALPAAMLLDYRVYDVRPRQISVSEDGLPEGAAAALIQQCQGFRRAPLAQAFAECLLDGAGAYQFERQIPDTEPPPGRRPRPRPRPARGQDDTFRPEDCSDSSDDDHRHMRDLYGRSRD